MSQVPPMQSSARRQPGAVLTERELVVLVARASGASWSQVAEELGLSRSTVRSAWASAGRKIRLAKEQEAA